jgi:hypothetical protein
VLYYEHSSLLLKCDKIKVGALPEGEVAIAYEIHTPPGRGVPAELKFWINEKEAATGMVQSTVPAGFTVAETFDVGMDLDSPVGKDY